MNPLAMVTADRSGRTRHRPEQWHDEAHTSHRAPRLRAAVLGANDGLLSTSSLVVGVAAAGAQRSVLLATGVAALISGAASMAMGEYSSVSSQRDAEAADLAMGNLECVFSPGGEAPPGRTALRCSLASLAPLRAAGFDLVTVAWLVRWPRP